MSHNVSRQLINGSGDAINADNIGGSGGTSDLQSAYNLSSEIITNTVNGGLTITRGSSSDVDIVFRIRNGSSGDTFSVLGNGNFSGNTGFLNILAYNSSTGITSTGSINNVSTNGVSIIRFTNNTGPSVSGFADGFPGKKLLVMYVGTGTMTLTHDSGGSVAENRILTGTNGQPFIIRAEATVELTYDGVSQRWRCPHRSVTGTGTLSRIAYWNTQNILEASSNIFTNGTTIHIGATTAPINGGVFAVTNSNTSTASTTIQPVQILGTFSPSSASATNYTNQLIRLTLGAAGAINQPLRNISSEILKNGTTAVAEIIGIQSNLTNNNATGAITNLMLYSLSVTNTTGLITNSFGYYIPPSGMSGTNRWGFYNDDNNANNFFRGQSSFGGANIITGATQLSSIFNNAIRIGNTTDSAATIGGGGLRWNGSDIQFSNGSIWSNIKEIPKNFIFFARIGTISFGQIVNPNFNSPTTSVGYLAPIAKTITGAKIVMGTHSASAASTFSIQIRKVTVPAGGLGSVITGASGSLLGTITYSTPGAEGVLFYKNFDSGSVSWSVSANEMVFCYVSEATFANVDDVYICLTCE